MVNDESEGMCVVCKKEVDWNTIVDEFEYIFDQVDSYGEDSLTENEQAVYHAHICSEECFENLK